VNRTSFKNSTSQIHLAIVYHAILLLIFLIDGCVFKKQSSHPETSVKFDQYYVQGEQLYIKNCSNCHQKEGTGLGLIYPPLKNSDYLLQNRDDVICLIRNGKSGELIVNGKSFNMAMPAMPSLTDLEIAEITTYIYNNWGHDQGLIEVSEVTAILAKCDSLQVD
jgi:cytochrome c551